MSTKESIKILIQGEDQASAKISEAAAKTKAALADIKQAGGQAKVSFEFIGTLASQLGGTEIGQFAGQMAQITEKTSQFTEVAKSGGAGAMAFKAGLAGLVATAAFSAGNFLGNIIFETEKWNDEIERGLARSKELSENLRGVAGLRFSDNKTDIELIRNPEEKRAAYQALLEEVTTNLRATEQQAKRSQKAAEEWADAWQITGNRKGFAKMAQDEAENDKKNLEMLRAQQKELERIVGIEAERAAIRKANQEAESDERSLQALQKRLELEKAIAGERVQMENARQKVKDFIAMDMQGRFDNTTNDQDFARKLELSGESTKWFTKQRIKEASTQFEVQAKQDFSDPANREKAAAIMEEIEATKILQEVQKEIMQERKAAMAAQEAASQKSHAAMLREAENLERQIILLRDGEEAAKIFALEKEGIDKENAKQFIAMQRQLEEQQKSDQTAGPTAANSAQESRVMLRGDIDMSPMQETAKNTEESKHTLNQMLEKLGTLVEKTSTPSQLQQLEFIGVGG